MTEPTQEEVLRRLMYPTPPINTQQGRWLYERAFGQQEWPPKRCSGCEGEGRLTLEIYQDGVEVNQTCPRCNGTGVER